MSAPIRPGGIALSRESIETARAFGTSGAASTAFALGSSLARETKLPPAIRAAYYEAADATKRLAELVSLAVEARDASVLATVAVEDAPPAANDAAQHTCGFLAQVERATRATDPAPLPDPPPPTARTLDIEEYIRRVGGHDPICSRLGPTAARVEVRGLDAEQREALRETLVRSTGWVLSVEERPSE